MIKMKIAITLLLFSITVATFAMDPGADAFLVEKRRNIVKEFDVNNKEALVLDNQFGLVKVALWDKNEIKVEIVITANAATDAKALEYLKAVEIQETREKGKLTLSTVINRSQFDAKMWENRKGDKNFIRIDYTVSMPKENPLLVKNRFGDINIPLFQAALTVDTRYGNFYANSLEGITNTIDVRYGNAKIGKIINGRIDSQYSDLKLDQVKKLLLNNKCGDLMIGEVTDLIADINYSGAKIGTIKGDGKIKLNYSGNFKIDEMTNSAENVNIDASYSSVVLPAEANKFNVVVSYGNFSYPAANVSFSMQPDKDDKSNKMRQYQGSVGAGSGTKITVVSKYGNVKLKD